MFRPLIIAVVTIIFGFTVSTAAAWGAMVTYTERQVGPNFEYAFMLNNNSGSAIYELYLDVPLSVSSLLNFTSPPAWGDGFGAEQPYFGSVLATTSFVEWWAGSGSELDNSKSLIGFGFLASSNLSGSILFSLNADPAIAGIVERGTSVPLPSSLLLMTSGLIWLVQMRKRIMN